MLNFTVDGGTVVGGPDENPRYQKAIEIGVHRFLQNDLDALFIATNAPGRSAFNRVERKMAPLSRELSGLIIPHDNFGSHLDDQRNTIDSVLEKTTSNMQVNFLLLHTTKNVKYLMQIF